MTRTVAIIQARMGSTRLPGKVLLDLAGEPMLARVVERARRAQRVDEVVVATTTHARDDAIAALCAERGWACFRGSEEDVLDRYHGAAVAHRADVVVRVTSDCPALSPAVLDVVIEARTTHRADYASNTIPPRTFPRGLDVEAMTFDALAAAWRDDANPAWREHVTPFLYRHPERFRVHVVTRSPDLSAHRWTVDTPDDLRLLRLLYAHALSPAFDLDEALRLLDAHPAWAEMNRNVEQKVV